MHQLRVQTAARGWPVLGDRLYGAAGPFADDAIALHARAIEVRHPRDQRTLRLTAPLPPAWAGRGLPDEIPVSRP
jgi:23S rRNA-/tRNA-specific pseudouridylate synthase